MPAHIHAELMKQYAEDAMQTEEPWKFWQYREDEYEDWETIKLSPQWFINVQYRRRPKFEVVYDNNLNASAWDFSDAANDLGVGVSGALFNNSKPILKEVIQKYLNRMTKEERQQLLDSI